jgi:hypothetical protein
VCHLLLHLLQLLLQLLLDLMQLAVQLLLLAVCGTGRQARQQQPHHNTAFIISLTGQRHCYAPSTFFST